MPNCPPHPQFYRAYQKKWDWVFDHYLRLSLVLSSQNLGQENWYINSYFPYWNFHERFRLIWEKDLRSFKFDLSSWIFIEMKTFYYISKFYIWPDMLQNKDWNIEKQYRQCLLRSFWSIFLPSIIFHKHWHSIYPSSAQKPCPREWLRCLKPIQNPLA